MFEGRSRLLETAAEKTTSPSPLGGSCRSLDHVIFVRRKGLSLTFFPPHDKDILPSTFLFPLSKTVFQEFCVYFIICAILKNIFEHMYVNVV